MARSRRRGAGPVLLPEELVVWEILVRLPAKPLLRCRAVCRSWRRRTSEAAFLLAHHRRQPSLPLVLFHGQLPHLADRRGRAVFVDAALDLRRRHPSERQPVLRFNDYNYFRDFSVHASCDGLLLLQFANHRFYLCNPATRQWTGLPALTGANGVALYPHTWSAYGDQSSTTSSPWAPSRRHAAGAAPSAKRFVGGYTSDSPAVLLHGCLHRLHHSSEKEDTVLAVFDTVAESFRTMRSPIAAAAAGGGGWERPQLLEMDGALAVSCVDTSQTMMKLWVLQDYEAGVWTLKRRVIFPLVEIRSIVTKDCNYRFYETVASEDGDVLLHRPGSVHLFHCGNRGDLLQNFSRNSVFPRPVGHCFRESLVRHEFFERKPGGARVRRLPRFFRGL
ncbi:hypothetical protein EJB05_42747, partial [Eragrostis curvula]